MTIILTIRLQEEVATEEERINEEIKLTNDELVVLGQCYNELLARQESGEELSKTFEFSIEEVALEDSSTDEELEGIAQLANVTKLKLIKKLKAKRSFVFIIFLPILSSRTSFKEVEYFIIY